MVGLLSLGCPDWDALPGVGGGLVDAVLQWMLMRVMGVVLLGVRT